MQVGCGFIGGVAMCRHVVSGDVAPPKDEAAVVGGGQAQARGGALAYANVKTI